MPCLQNKDAEYSQLEETPVNLKRLLEKLQGQISKQWYQLGLSLGLPMDVLEGFNLYSEDDCLVEVLDYWLKHHPSKPTWQEITDAQKKVEIFNTEQDSGTIGCRYWGGGGGGGGWRVIYYDLLSIIPMAYRKLDKPLIIPKIDSEAFSEQFPLIWQ